MENLNLKNQTNKKQNKNNLKSTQYQRKNFSGKKYTGKDFKLFLIMKKLTITDCMCIPHKSHYSEDNPIIIKLELHFGYKLKQHSQNTCNCNVLPLVSEKSEVLLHYKKVF